MKKPKTWVLTDEKRKIWIVECFGKVRAEKCTDQFQKSP